MHGMYIYTSYVEHFIFTIPIKQRWQDPVGKVLNGLTWRDKVEINWCNNNPNTMCYNPTAVDYFGLPVNIGPDNPSDCPNTTPVTGAGDIKRSSIQSNCPTQFITTSPFGVKYILWFS